MTGIFKQKNPANLIILLVFGVLIKLPAFLQPQVPGENTSDGILFRVLVDLIRPLGNPIPIIYPILAYLFLFLQAVILTHFMNNQRMMTRANYFPGMAYMLITSLIPEWNHFSAPLLVNFILVWILADLFKIYNQSKVLGQIFNIGLLLGLACFLYFPAIIFLIWFLLSLAIIRPFQINEWLVACVGSATPFYFYTIYLIVSDNWSWAAIWPNVSVRVPEIVQNIWLALRMCLLVLPFLIGLYYFQIRLRRLLIPVRKAWSLLLLHLLCALFGPFINSDGSFQHWIMVAIPLAAFHACTYLYPLVRIIPLLLFWITTTFILVYQYH